MQSESKDKQAARDNLAAADPKGTPAGTQAQESSQAITDPSVGTAEFNSRVEVGQSRVGASKAKPEELPARFGRYQIQGVLGSGGFGTVYLGFDDQLKRKVAIKVPRRVLTGIELDRFLEEARRLARLRHSGIVTVFDVGESDGKCYIVSDYLEGISLEHWIESEPYTWRQAALVTIQLAQALAQAHSQGIVHRDIKPSNVVMLPSDQPVLIDFGLAISDTHGEVEFPGMIAGTPSYMSPEQAKGKAHRIDGRTDIYGLGATLYHLLCRKKPFRPSGGADVFRQIVEDEPQPPRQIVPETPVELERICLKAMAKRASDRYTTALDMAADLQKLIDEATTSDRADIPVVPAATRDEASGSRRSSEHRLHEAERRQITTLHLDLDDSAFEVDALDPEELHAILQRIRELTARVVGRFGGHLAQNSTEAIQIYFGYPRAVEDSARRALLAALEISKDIQAMQQRLRVSGELTLEYRMGIHTGIVVTEEQESDVSSERHSIVGNVPRVAAGLTELAATGGVIVSESTRQIVGEVFDYKSLGVHSSKSIGRNVEVWEVVGLRSAPSSPAEPLAGSVPLIGRAHELGLLNDRWALARGGSGQVVLLCAEPGVGKSRLLAAFREAWSVSDVSRLEARCSTYHPNSAFHPISELLLRLARIDPEDQDATKLAKLEALLRQYELPLDATVPLLAELISVAPGPAYAVLEATPERRKQKTIETLVELTLIATESQPLIFTVEDLHWADPSTLEFLTVLIEQVYAAPVLLVMTHRPTFTPPWPARPGLAQLTIGHLTSVQSRELVARIAGGRKLPETVLDHVVRKAGGVPLFAEELTKAILESDLLEESGDELVLTRSLASVDIPATLQDSLMARLDRLGGAKEIAQLASVIGREFTYPLLAAIAPLDDQTLQAELTCLVDAELVHQRGFFPRARFAFKHALVRDIAYGSLLRKARQQWHGRIAEVLESKFPQIAAAEPELLALHHTESGQIQRAISAWLKAGLHAQEQSANAEAIHHLRKGLKLIDSLDASEERELLEFQFQIPLGVSLLATQGYASPEVGPIFERARVLSQKFGGPVEQFHILWGTWAWRVVREELKVCLEYADEAPRMVAPTNDLGLRTEALFIPILTSFYVGDFANTVRCCEQAIQLCDEALCRLHARQTGQNFAVTMRCYWALSLWHLGYPDQARQRIQNAIDLARSIQHPFSLAYALGHSAWMHHTCRMSDVLKRSVDEEIALASEKGFLFWVAEGTLHRGFLHLLEGRTAESLEALQTGLAIFDLTGAKLSLGHFYSAVAHAHLLAGHLDDASRWIDDALRASAANGNAFYLAEIHRLRGEIMLSRGDELEAERSLNDALQIARSQNARSWELRATMSLFRLRQQQNRAGEARPILQSVYDWFQEGFSTPDLIDAKRLLDSSR